MKFNFKSLAFYGGAIAGVVVLFEFVTKYGETYLKAPPLIEGRYPLTFAQKPDCLKSDALVLTIQQSGSYLSASLLPINANAPRATSASEKPFLTGQLSNQHLNISGADKVKICNNAVSQTEIIDHSTDNQPSFVNIQGRVEGKTLQGQIKLSSISQAIEFTAQRESRAQPSEKSTSH